jgi:hypothetical protein
MKTLGRLTALLGHRSLSDPLEGLDLYVALVLSGNYSLAVVMSDWSYSYYLRRVEAMIYSGLIIPNIHISSHTHIFNAIPQFT